MSEAIKQAEANLERTRQKAEVLVNQFSVVVPAYSGDLVDYFIKSGVEQNPDLTQALGKDGRLKELKTGFVEILKTAPEKAKQQLQSFKWPHREKPPETIESGKFYEVSKSVSESLDGIIRDVTGAAGKLLVEFGYERRGSKMGTRSAWEDNGNGLQYSYGLPDHFSDNGKLFRELKQKYHEFLTTEYEMAAQNLVSAIRARKQAEAKSLWDNA